LLSKLKEENIRNWYLKFIIINETINLIITDVQIKTQYKQ